MYMVLELKWYRCIASRSRPASNSRVICNQTTSPTVPNRINTRMPSSTGGLSCRVSSNPVDSIRKHCAPCMQERPHSKNQTFDSIRSKHEPIQAVGISGTREKMSHERSVISHHYNLPALWCGLWTGIESLIAYQSRSVPTAAFSLMIRFIVSLSNRWWSTRDVIVQQSVAGNWAQWVHIFPDRSNTWNYKWK